MLSLQNISILSHCYCPCTWWEAHVSHWYSLHIRLSLETFPGTLVKALAAHHLCRSRADSKGALAQNYTEHNVLWNKMQRRDLFICPQRLPTIAFPNRLTYWRNEAYSRELVTHWMCFVFWNVHSSIFSAEWKHKITQCSKRTIEAWVAWISLYRNMQMCCFPKAFKWCQNVLKLVYSVS